VYIIGGWNEEHEFRSLSRRPNKKEIRIPATSQEQVKANPRRNDVSKSYCKHWLIVGEFSTKDYRYAG